MIRVFQSFQYNNDLAGLSLTLTSSYLQNIRNNKVYNNTFYNNGHNPDAYIRSLTGIFFAIYSGSKVIEQNVIKNNLLYEHREPFDEYNINTPDRRGLITQQIFINNWDGDTQGDPKFVNASTTLGDPMDASLPDLRLESNSPCQDAGTYLTSVTSPSGSGTAFQVADAGYFMDGWGIAGVQGDEIQLWGSAQRARITAIDYSTSMITVDGILTWTQNQSISLSYEGAAPDVGAYEFAPQLELHGAPANQTIHLSWTVKTTLPVTSTWQITYDGPTGGQPSPISGIINPTHAYTLTGLTNYTWYTVTLNAMSGSTPFLTDTVRVMPSDIFVYLPLVLSDN